MNINSIKIRPAQIEDISAIYNLVLELADFEEAKDQVKIDLDYYIQEWKNETFKAIVAEYNGNVIGTCIYYMTFSTWKGRCVYLEDFVVQQSFRHHGIGQRLYDHLLAVAKEDNASMIRWQVLDWNELAIKFYEKNKATIQKEWWNCKVVF